ncbi:MAG: hypothetical protein WC875_02650 [Candidatus Absconditabacterales bacterium]
MSLFLAIFNSLLRMPVAIKRKMLRNKNASAVGTFAAMVFAIPLRLVGLLFFAHLYGFIFSSQYLVYVLIRAILCIMVNLGETFLCRFQALAEYSIYALVFSTIISWSVDYFYFHTIFSVTSFIGIFLLFSAGLMMSVNKKTETKNKRTSLKLYQMIVGIFLLSVINVFLMFLYKKGVNIQTYPIVHGMFSQLVMFPIVALISRKWLQQDIKKRLIGVRDIVLLASVVFVYTLIEPFVMKSLPIVVITLISSLRLIVYAFFDMRKKEFQTNIKAFVALIISVGAIVLISL